MTDSSTFVAVDWGTSNLRMSLVTRGKCQSSWDSADGIAVVHRAWKEGRLQSSREASFTEVLKAGLANLKPPENTLMVVSGMASSSLGLRELPYARLPFALDGTGAVREWLDRSLLLTSGVASDEDVMRGEEVQITGLNALGYGDGLYLLPGTHSKHVQVAAKAIVAFETHMTGELFDLLATQSTIGPAIRAPQIIDEGKAFVRGVEDGFRGNLLHRMFTVRALSVLRAEMPNDGYERLSGTLIGYELQAIRGIESTIYLAARADLAERYLRAGEILGMQMTRVEASDWANAGWRGQRCILEREARSS